MVGKNTVMIDNPKLTTELAYRRSVQRLILGCMEEVSSYQVLNDEFFRERV